MAARKDPAREIRAQTQQVTLLGLKRLEALLSDPDASNADVLKGLSLLFERVCEHPGAFTGFMGMNMAGAAGGAIGDFEIRLTP